MAHDISRIATWLQPQEILLDVDARDRSHALEIAEVGSTALGKGFAIPHARISGITRPTTVFMRTKLAIAFEAPDGKPVSQLLVIMVPTDGAKDDHLQLLALVARLFSGRRFRRRLDSAPDTAAAADAFRTGIAQVIAASS